MRTSGHLTSRSDLRQAVAVDAPIVCDSPALLAAGVSNVLHNLTYTVTVRCQGWLSSCLRNPDARTCTFLTLPW